MVDKEIFEYEEKKLKETIEKIKRKIEITEENFKKQENFIIGFKEGQRGTQFLRQNLMSLYAIGKENLIKSLPNPYFGRFIFKEENSVQEDTIYIGKRLITDESDNILAYDWRSPICSMYYDFNIGKSNYSANNTKINGEILNKRQIYIKNGQLINVEEEDTLSNDNILIKYLSENSDARLKSIIATIQKEQNKIIRNPNNENRICQGVAGSGKTTVALHRIAYVLYNDSKNSNESDFMIIGPNKYFLNYISDLLPDLDVGNISQKTIEDLGQEVLKKKYRYESKNDNLKKVMLNKYDRNIIKYKSSLEYLKEIEKFIYNYVNYYTKNNLEYENIILYNVDNIKNILNDKLVYKEKSYSEKIAIIKKQITKKVKESKDEIYYEIRKNYLETISNPNTREKLAKIKKDLEKGCSSYINNYFKFLKVNPLVLYQKFIENVSFPQHIDRDKIKGNYLNNLKQKTIAQEDIVPLIYIDYILNNNNKYQDYKHLIIDEAQDLSIAQYYVIKKLFPNANIEVFGDINQSIYDYQSINEWDELNEKIFEDKAKYEELNKSYRNTSNITNTSNLVLELLDKPYTETISREGDEIVINKYDEDNVKIFIEQIAQILEKGYETIALICKDQKEVDKLYSQFQKLGLDIKKIEESNDKYNGGICLLPSYLSKGLEFDAVIITDANSDKYKSNQESQRLLYVAITRAMHELYINYQNEITESLKPLIKKEKIRKR